ncbi:MAG: class I SAM-dependent rRNA methyltransferase [Deltaproteobacteria bacterium]|nr:class I SAM-dependent rRNA methyltransferase [Deltaproteobacteria bacterium]
MLPASTTAAPGVVTVHRRGVERLQRGAPWVFRGDVLQAPAADGDVVEMRDGRGKPVGVALWAERGPLALRRWGPPGSRADNETLCARLDAAMALRERALPGVTAVRLVHGEADALPGLFVDRYGDALCVQTACAAMERRLPAVVARLRAACAPALVVRRDDGSARDLEQLPRVKEILHGGPGTAARYRVGALTLEADLLHGPKTGAYLDQRDNHLLAGRVARGRCLDAFSALGGFGLQMAARAQAVICLEQEPQSVDAIRRNAAVNGLLDRVDARAANAFDALRALHDARERFDTVVVDPPALAKRAGPPEGALRGYFELNRRAIQLCRPGAFLLSFSCSGRVTVDLLEDVVLQAARATRRFPRLLARLAAGPDHPGRSGLPEAEYLKGVLLQVP